MTTMITQDELDVFVNELLDKQEAEKDERNQRRD